MKKSITMEDMMHFAYVKNEGWVPNWEMMNRINMDCPLE